MDAIRPDTIFQVAAELNRRAATILPQDVRARIDELKSAEQYARSCLVLDYIVRNWRAAESDSRPLCADTGLPRYYVRSGNEARIDGGFVALEKALRQATAYSTESIPLRPNRVHPITREDLDNNVGAHAPSLQYAFEPHGKWIDITAVHKGGLFGSDYRMLFPIDGVAGIKKFFLTCVGQFFQRGLSCPPVIVGVGIGGTKDDCFRLGQEASCLRLIGDRHPEHRVADLELELLSLGQKTGYGPMGFRGNSAIMDVHIEVAYAHTGGMPVSVHHFCFATRRHTARIHNDNRIEYREDPQWFTDYYRREGI